MFRFVKQLGLTFKSSEPACWEGVLATWSIRSKLERQWWPSLFFGISRSDEGNTVSFMHDSFIEFPTFLSVKVTYKEKKTL